MLFYLLDFGGEVFRFSVYRKLLDQSPGDDFSRKDSGPLGSRDSPQPSLRVQIILRGIAYTGLALPETDDQFWHNGKAHIILKNIT